jgi:hypothetical protein
VELDGELLGDAEQGVVGALDRLVRVPERQRLEQYGMVLQAVELLASAGRGEEASGYLCG